MSLGEQLLASDLAAYMRGEQPPEVEIATAPRLDVWSAEVTVGSWDARISLTLRGEVSGHPTHSNGRQIETSAVAWLDRDFRWARTASRLYVLDGRAIDMEGLIE